MKTILPKHHRFANPTQWRRARNPSGRTLKRTLRLGVVAEPGTFLDWLKKRARLPSRPYPARPVPRLRIQARARIRARRSPASQRRATTDSGGDDGGGDPEPPQRPHLCSLPAYMGGAL